MLANTHDYDPRGFYHAFSTECVKDKSIMEYTYNIKISKCIFSFF